MTIFSNWTPALHCYAPSIPMFTLRLFSQLHYTCIQGYNTPTIPLFPWLRNTSFHCSARSELMSPEVSEAKATILTHSDSHPLDRK